MPSLKSIRKRISSVKSTQKITRAMKMVAGARLNRAQQRITELRPYALKTREVLVEVTAEGRSALTASMRKEAPESPEVEGTSEEGSEPGFEFADRRSVLPAHPLLEETPERRVVLVVMTSDRGLCGSFNASICKLAELEWRRRIERGQIVQLVVVGRKGRDYFRRRQAPMEYIEGVWDDVSIQGARKLARTILAPFLRQTDRADAVYVVYNEFKSAISQKITCERLLPVETPAEEGKVASEDVEVVAEVKFEFEPGEGALLEQLVPMYVQTSVLRAMLESIASELGARMTAMDSATSNASDMIARLTLQYNRARQAAITKELMEIIGGSEALKG
ncbi:MAG: ATP synthase F1 subunit gamma [Deltaproteobacteria bacterium]|nr:ATP synthase F1 subunit gamma [Deltaproteobacteria bacterium]